MWDLIVWDYGLHACDAWELFVIVLRGGMWVVFFGGCGCGCGGQGWLGGADWLAGWLAGVVVLCGGITDCICGFALWKFCAGFGVGCLGFLMGRIVRV